MHFAALFCHLLTKFIFIFYYQIHNLRLQTNATACATTKPYSFVDAAASTVAERAKRKCRNLDAEPAFTAANGRPQRIEQKALFLLHARIGLRSRHDYRKSGPLLSHFLFQMLRLSHSYLRRKHPWNRCAGPEQPIALSKLLLERRRSEVLMRVIDLCGYASGRVWN